jgi:RNA polymerase sigma-70 factor, ECF subfamily
MSNLQREEVDASSEHAEQFAELLRSNHRQLFVFIYSLVQNRADAEDVYQQTTLVMWKKFSEFTPGTNFGAWAARVAHLTARHFIRTKRRNRVYFSDGMLELLADSYAAPRPGASERRMDALARCLEKLPRRERRLVDSCYSEECDIASLAESSNRSVAAVYQALYRIRKALLTCVERTLAAENR